MAGLEPLGRLVAAEVELDGSEVVALRAAAACSPLVSGLELLLRACAVRWSILSRRAESSEWSEFKRSQRVLAKLRHRLLSFSLLSLALGDACWG